MRHKRERRRAGEVARRGGRQRVDVRALGTLRCGTHLEGEAEVLAVVEHGLLGGLVAVAEDGGRAARRRDEARRLEERLFEVRLDRDARVEERRRLRDLAVGKVRNHLRDELDHLHSHPVYISAPQPFFPRQVRCRSREPR